MQIYGSFLVHCSTLEEDQDIIVDVKEYRTKFIGSQPNSMSRKFIRQACLVKGVSDKTVQSKRPGPDNNSTWPYRELEPFLAVAPN